MTTYTRRPVTRIEERIVELFDSPRFMPNRVVVRAVARDGGPLVMTPHADKAISQRATVLAALGQGTSRLRNLADCADVRSNLRALGRLGVPLQVMGHAALSIDGVLGPDFRIDGATLDAGNSATTSRLLLSVLAGTASECVVTGNRLLRARPMCEILDPLRELGADIEELGGPGQLPVRVRGAGLRGACLSGGTVTVHVDSAQPVSALQFAALGAADPVRIRRRTVARDHTERLLHWTGVPVRQSDTEVEVTPARPRAFDLTIPGDPSGAGLLAALHLASPDRHRELTLTGVGLNPLRTGFFRILSSMGATLTEKPVETSGPEPVGDVTLRADSPLRGAVIEGPRLVQSAIDELPLAAALASVAVGPTVIRDAAELRGKDSDRIATTVELLHAFGVAAEATDDGLVVHPGPDGPRSPGRVELPADHRVIFAAFVLAVLSGGCELFGVRAADTSHPGAFDDLARFARLELL